MDVISYALVFRCRLCGQPENRLILVMGECWQISVYVERFGRDSDAADPAGREPGCEAATLPRSAADLELGLVPVERMLDDG